MICFILSAILVLGCGTTSVGAKTLTHTPNSNVIVTRATGWFSMSVPAHTIRQADSSFPMEYNETITISATYTPSNASVDFWLYGPDGVFGQGSDDNRWLVISSKGARVGIDWDAYYDNMASSLIRGGFAYFT